MTILAIAAVRYKSCLLIILALIMLLLNLAFLGHIMVPEEPLLTTTMEVK